MKPAHVHGRAWCSTLPEQSTFQNFTKGNKYNSKHLQETEPLNTRASSSHRHASHAHLHLWAFFFCLNKQSYQPQEQIKWRDWQKYSRNKTRNKSGSHCSWNQLSHHPLPFPFLVRFHPPDYAVKQRNLNSQGLSPFWAKHRSAGTLTLCASGVTSATSTWWLCLLAKSAIGSRAKERNPRVCLIPQ